MNQNIINSNILDKIISGDYSSLYGARFSQYYNHFDDVSEKLQGWICYGFDIPNLLVEEGTDWWHNQLYGNTVAGTRGANYISLSEDTSTPDTDWVVLPSEIVDTGLARAEASPAPSHIAGTNVTVVEKTFSPTGVKTIRLGGLHYAGSGSNNLVNAAQWDKIVTTANGSSYRALVTITLPVALV